MESIRQCCPEGCRFGYENMNAKCCFPACKTPGILMILVLFFSSRHEITAFPQTNNSSVWTNSLKALPKSYSSLECLIYIRLKVWGPGSIFQIVPFISLTDKKYWSPAEVFPFATLTCAQCIDHSSMICESNWLSAEAVSPSSARTGTELKQNLYSNVITTILFCRYYLTSK